MKTYELFRSTILVAFMLSACGESSDALPDAGTATDGGGDGGPVDSGSADAGPQDPDAGFAAWDGVTPPVRCRTDSLRVSGGVSGLAVEVDRPRRSASGRATTLTAHATRASIHIKTEQQIVMGLNPAETFLHLSNWPFGLVCTSTTVDRRPGQFRVSSEMIRGFPRCQEVGTPGPGTIELCLSPIDRTCPGATRASIESTVPGFVRSVRDVNGSIGGGAPQKEFAVDRIAGFTNDDLGYGIIWFADDQDRSHAFCVGDWTDEGARLRLGDLTPLGTCDDAMPFTESGLAICYSD